MTPDERTGIIEAIAIISAVVVLFATGMLLIAIGI